MWKILDRCPEHLRLTFIACKLSISGESWTAHAQWTVCLNMTFRILGTDMTFGTRIPTLLIDACLVTGAFWIADTFRSWRRWFIALHRALNEGRAYIAHWARTNRFMVDGFTNGVHTARIYARIAALLVVARSVVWAIIIGYAFWVCANGSTVDHLTMAIQIAWWRIAWINWFSGFTFDKWIANCLRWTRTDWTVVEGVADGCIAACARTWVNAFCIDAGLIARTIWTDCTFWMAAVSRRISVIARNTFTNSVLVALTTHCVQTAWRRIAWIANATDWLYVFHHFAMTECIARCSSWTRTNRNVIGHRAHGLDAANAWARISAAITYASFVHWAIRIADAFGPTTFIRITMIFRNTFANGIFVLDTAVGIDAARRWIAWVFLGFWR